MDVKHESFMNLALEQAKLAELQGEVPVGAVLVKDDVVIGQGHNQCITNNDPSLHAEFVAIRQACKTLNNYRLPGCTLYVTLEPCSMCAGMLVHSRIDTLVFGAHDAKTGAAGSVLNIVQHEHFNHQINVVEGVLKEPCANILSHFFKLRRKAIKENKQIQNK